jgi:hypothetical protein
MLLAVWPRAVARTLGGWQALAGGDQHWGCFKLGIVLEGKTLAGRISDIFKWLEFLHLLACRFYRQRRPAAGKKGCVEPFGMGRFDGRPLQAVLIIGLIAKAERLPRESVAGSGVASRVNRRPIHAWGLRPVFHMAFRTTAGD